MLWLRIDLTIIVSKSIRVGKIFEDFSKNLFFVPINIFKLKFQLAKELES